MYIDPLCLTREEMVLQIIFHGGQKLRFDLSEGNTAM